MIINPSMPIITPLAFNPASARKSTSKTNIAVDTVFMQISVCYCAHPGNDPGIGRPCTLLLLRLFSLILKKPSFQIEEIR